MVSRDLEGELGRAGYPGYYGVTDVVVPSPSGLSRMSFEELGDHYYLLTPVLG